MRSSKNSQPCPPDRHESTTEALRERLRAANEVQLRRATLTALAELKAQEASEAKLRHKFSCDVTLYGPEAECNCGAEDRRIRHGDQTCRSSYPDSPETTRTFPR